ncbi:MAG TPA: transcription elongation factor GreB [Myxococcota bacterium]|jgi:transcription elongation factor GreB|nr:transcription elongation factor GreB [Myxococcota bacterium]
MADDESEAPRRPGSRYITPEGYRRLQDEVEMLWKVERPRVTREVAAAAAQGDRSENAEYQYGKKKLREIDRRVHFLNKRLEELVVVREAPADASRVFFGAFVRLEGDEGETLEFRIVGPDEFDPETRRISIESPMARAVLGKEEGDEVEVARPKGRSRFTILRVRYEASEA